jgi:uncharacterized membrane protein YeaQ/YmgE (transglycosylase-associated protein family)
MIEAAMRMMPLDRHIMIDVSMHSLIGWIIIGLIAGWLAGTLARGRGFGCLVNVILGLVGAVIGGWIFSRLGIAAWGFFGSLAAATVGAVVLVAVARIFSSSKD